MKKTILFFFLFPAVFSTAFAQLQINAVATPYTIDFTGFTGAGFQPTAAAGQLSSDTWSATGFSNGDLLFGGTQVTAGTDFTRGASNGFVGTGGIYAFNTGAGNIILGVQPVGDDFTPGDFRLQMQNTTGNVITSLMVSYNIWYLNNEERANSMNFSHSSDNTTYTNIASLDFTTPEVAAAFPVWTAVSRSTVISGLNIANNAMYYVRWLGNDVSGTGSRDEYGIDTITVMANPPAIAANFSASNSNVCLGDSTCFTDLSFSTNGPLTSWSWDFGDGNLSTIQNPCHTYTAAGTYTVQLIVTNTGGDSDTASSAVTVNDLPAAAYTYTVNGSTVDFTDASTIPPPGNIVSWNWNFPGGNPSTSTSQNPTVTYTANGTYTVCLTSVSADGCMGTYCDVVNITTVGVSETELSSSIIIYPNPSSGKFRIQNSEFRIQNVEIYNSIGKCVFKSLTPDPELLIDLSSQPSGIYFYKLKSSDETIATGKIVIQ